MTMVSTGPISLGGSATTAGLNQSVNIELGRSATASINMNESAVRTLAGVPSGQISMSNFYGKSNQFAFTIGASQVNANLRTLAVNAGWNQSSAVVATINPGVFIYATSTGTPALTINGSFPNGVTLVNNGVIQGQGGNAGAGGGMTSGIGRPGVAGSGGGLALSVSVAVSINNGGGRIAGGGGGGGGGGGVYYFAGKAGTYSAGGGGGGGGLGGNGGAGGAGGVATSGSIRNGNPGGGGTLTTNGGGGAGGSPGFVIGGSGGAGGSYGASGAGGANASGPGGSNIGAGAGGGPGGGAIAGNGNIAWIAFGTLNGGIS